MGRFRKKPVEIYAIQYIGHNKHEVEEFIWRVGGLLRWGPKGQLFIKTLEGTMEAQINDWIIRGVQDEIYPCKPDIFEQTYEAVDG